MCGIVGYNGNQQAAPILLKGLEKLEYRGYDSAVLGTGENRQKVSSENRHFQSIKNSQS